MLWKVFNIQTGKILRAGFASEDEAKEWLELKSDALQDNYEVDDMDPDEVEEWQEGLEADDEDDEEEELEEPTSVLGYGEEYYDGEDLADDSLSVIEDDDEPE